MRPAVALALAPPLEELAPAEPARFPPNARVPPPVLPPEDALALASAEALLLWLFGVTGPAPLLPVDAGAAVVLALKG